MAHELAADLNTEDLQQASPEDRLERVTEFLNQRGYLARWEQNTEDPNDGFLLHKCNCPYAGVSSEHNELCMMDQVLINELMGEACQRILSMAHNDRCCTYRVGGSKSDLSTGCAEEETALAPRSASIILFS
jgi:predicted ArsR family transcriptional regulator